MTVPLAKADPRLNRFPLGRQRLPVAGGNLSIVAPKPGTWLQQVQRRDSAEPPYWTDIWPASLALARWLCRRTDLAGRRVLDLGCGLGVAGAGAARAGASVTCADLSPDALAFAAFNVRQNGGATALAAVLPLDWHRQEVPAGFALIALADVTYRPVHHRAILRQLEVGLGDDGIAVHCDPFRKESDGFLAAARPHFAMHQHERDTHFGDHRVPIRFTFLCRSAAALAAWRVAAAAPGGAA